MGTDFALSIGQVAGQLIAHQMLGDEYVSLEPMVKIVKVDGSSSSGRHPLDTSQRGRADALDACFVAFPEIRLRHPAGMTAG